MSTRQTIVELPQRVETTRARGWLRDAMLIGVAGVIATAVFLRLDATALLAGITLLACVAVFFRWPQFAVLAGVGFLYLNLPAILTKFHGLSPLLAGAPLLLLAIPALRANFSEGRWPVFDRVLGLMIGVYLPLLLISALLSEQPDRSYARLLAFAAEGILVYFLVLNAVTSRAILRKVIWTVVLAGVLMGALSVLQETTSSYYSSYGGLAQVQTHDEDTGEKTRPRLAGPIGEKNRYAQVLLVLLPLVVLLGGTETRRMRIAAGIAGLIIVCGILLTFSRAAAVTAALAMIGMGALRQIRWRQLALAGVGVAILALIFAPAYLERLTSLADLTHVFGGQIRGVDGALKGRATENLAAWNTFLDHPLFGVGTGQTRHYVAQYSQESGLRRLAESRRAHSMYLEELSDTGLLGFGCFMLIIGITLRRLWVLRREAFLMRPTDALFLTAILLALGTYLVSATFLHLSYLRYFWFLMGLAGAAARIYAADDEADFREEAA